LYDLMYPVSVLTNVLSILDTFNTGTGLTSASGALDSITQKI